jgi:hypothetical protein
MIYKILELRKNIDLNKNHPSFYTFDVLVTLIKENEEKWLSVPYEMYFEWVLKNNKKLSKYIEKREFAHHLHLLSDLDEIGFKFEESLMEYINIYYPENIYLMLPCYYPDEFDFI